MQRVLSTKLIADRAMADRELQGRLTLDSFQNFAAKIGIGTNNISSGATYGFNPITRVRQLLEWMYRGSWLCGVGVDCIADDMTREWIEVIGDLTPTQNDRLMRTMRRMQIPQSFNQVVKWGRLYGGAMGVYIIEGQRLDTPLRLETVAPGQFKGIITLDRWMVTPDINTAITTPGPDFGNPEWYTIDAQTPNLPIPRQRLHHTRLFRMEGVELPFWQKQAENMWGMSVLERLYDRLVAFDSTTQGAAQQMYRAYLRTMKIKNLRSLIAAGGPMYQALLKNISLVRQYQSIEGMTLIDADDEFEGVQNTFAGQAEIITAIGEQVSGALETPITRLFGQPPGGLNSDGDSSMRMYEDQINRKQERWFRRPLDIVIPLCAINAKVELGDDWDFHFVSLRQLTEKEKAEVNTADTNGVVAVAGTGAVPASAILKELRSSGRKTGRWSSITDEMITEAEAAETVPSPDDLGIGPNSPTQSANPDKVTQGEEGEKPDGDKEDKDQPKPGETRLSIRQGGKDRQSLLDVQGLQIFIETHLGHTRKGNGWSVIMPADYGFIEGVGSAEGAFEQMDCYLGPYHNAPDVYIIDQQTLEGAFDEHKCMIGFKSLAQAKDVYMRAFSDGTGAQRMNAVTTLSMRRFKTWLAKGNHKMPIKGQV